MDAPTESRGCCWPSQVQQGEADACRREKRLSGARSLEGRGAIKLLVRAQAAGALSWHPRRRLRGTRGYSTISGSIREPHKNRNAQVDIEKGLEIYVLRPRILGRIRSFPTYVPVNVWRTPFALSNQQSKQASGHEISLTEMHRLFVTEGWQAKGKHVVVLTKCNPCRPSRPRGERRSGPTIPRHKVLVGQVVAKSARKWGQEGPDLAQIGQTSPDVPRSLASFQRRRLPTCGPRSFSSEHAARVTFFHTDFELLTRWLVLGCGTQQPSKSGPSRTP